METLFLRHTPETCCAAQACIRLTEQLFQGERFSRASPLSSALEFTQCLEHDSQMASQVWLINDRVDNSSSQMAISAWPLWFSEKSRSSERPLFYLAQSPTSAHMAMLTSQTFGRGIILNDIESVPSRWPKGAHPWLPLWLASNPQCLPFDPACVWEVKEILSGALQELYVRGMPGFCYINLHNQVEDLADNYARCGAYKGMYRVSAPTAAEVQVRLLGAGIMLREVIASARLLADDWGILSEVWSCPSYTRLSREADAALSLQRSQRMTCHLYKCLDGWRTPVIAVTGYAEFVAAQLGRHIKVPFTALGADSLAPNQQLDRHWITYSALRSLVQASQLDAEVLHQALERYRLA